MIKITPITTADELCRSHGAATGNILVDGLVDFLQHTRSCKAEDAAIYLEVPQRLLSEAIRFFVGSTVQNVILRWRAYQALDLLDQPDMTREAVAEYLQLGSVKTLEGLFRKQFGTTIEAYRTGNLRRNSNFGFNQKAESRRKVISKANELKKRD